MDLKQERLSNLFEYLKAVELRRKPRITQVKEQYWSIFLGDLPRHVTLAFDPSRISDEEGCWLKIKKPKLSPPPKPPVEIVDWLEPGWDIPGENDPSVMLTRKIQVNEQVIDDRFDVSPVRKNLFYSWLSQWRHWSESELPARQVDAVWQQIFSIHNDLLREGERLELMLGDGLFHFAGGQVKVFHPLVLKGVARTFDPVEKEFRFFDQDRPSEFFASAFSDDKFVSFDVKKWRGSLELQDLHPLDGETLSHYLKGIAGSIDDGEFLEGFSDADERKPTVFRHPVLFVRKRETGLAEYIDEILQHIPVAESFPSSLLGIVGVNSSLVDVDDDREGEVYANEHKDLLLTKPANAEQVEILKRLSRDSDVLVQGPPGTGKTHTIANVIGSLLAQGKSVLVTSHSAKALRVVREKVAEPLRNLCVSVLDNDKESRVQREAAIRELSGRLSDNPDLLEKEAELLSAQRAKLLDTIGSKRQSLLDAVEGEYRPLVMQGQQVFPADAAKEVAAGIGLHDWIPGQIDDLEPMPISSDDVRFLYSSGRSISSDDEFELDGALPGLSDVPGAAEFREWVSDEAVIEKDGLLHYRTDLWVQGSSPASVLQALERNLIAAIELLKGHSAQEWKLAIVDAGINGGSRKNVWNLLCDQIKKVRESANESSEIIFGFQPELNDVETVTAQYKILSDIEVHIKNKGSIQWYTHLTAREWSKHIKAWRTNNRQPEKLDDFISLKKLAALEIDRAELIRNWERMCVPIGMPSIKDRREPEEYAIQFVSQIDVLLSWHDSTWSPLLAGLESEGLKFSLLLSEAPPTDRAEHRAISLLHTVESALPNVVRSECLRRELTRLKQEFEALQSRVNSIQSKRLNESALLSSFFTAVKTRSVLEYESAIQRFIRLQSLFSEHKQRVSLLAVLESRAPSWAASIRRRDAKLVNRDEELPFEPAIAWRYLQLFQELDRRSELNIQEILQNLQVLTSELEKVTTALVEKRAWLGLLRKVTFDQRQALLGWAATMKKIGAGTGRLVPELRKQAKREMEKARGAVPVWIMPFAGVTSSFHPVRDRFDVLIVDEASQEDILGLATFYMTDKVIVVGDDEQVTPLDVGGEQSPVQNLISQWLGDLPSPRLFDTKTSIYDRAQISFGSVIRLREHFRCVPEIIQFSNALCYDFSIRPLREAASTEVKPALVAHRVDGRSSGKVNEEEAAEITRLIRACFELPEYIGKTFGVISMVGDEQAKLVDKYLRQHLDPVLYDDRRILCGNPAQFQGDERDVIFLTLVDSKPEIGPLTLRQDGADGLWKKRFNVAASRARDQLWVVYSLEHTTQLKPGDIRKRLIEHALDPTALMQRLSSGVDRAESPFEVEVLKILVAKGFKVTPQWEVGAYRIDMVVEGNDQRLAIECDGDRWHYDKAEEDLARQALLERLGWKFVRIRGSTFYRDKSEHRAEAMAPVFRRLEELGIKPFEPSHSDSRTVVSELLEQILRSASALKESPPVELNLEERVVIEDAPRSPAVSKGHEPYQQATIFDASSTSAQTEITEGKKVAYASKFFKGQKVSHQKFGIGRVMGVSGTREEMTVQVDFSVPWGVRDLSVKMAKLTIISD